MSDERTCRTCWHWRRFYSEFGFCEHPDCGGSLRTEDDTCDGHVLDGNSITSEEAELDAD